MTEKLLRSLLKRSENIKTSSSLISIIFTHHNTDLDSSLAAMVIHLLTNWCFLALSGKKEYSTTSLLKISFINELTVIRKNGKTFTFNQPI